MSRFLRDRFQTLEPYTPGEQPKTLGRLIKLNTNENPYEPVSYTHLNGSAFRAVFTCGGSRQCNGEFYTEYSGDCRRVIGYTELEQLSDRTFCHMCRMCRRRSGSVDSHR